jgi:uncharacterized membrane protein YjdF
MFEPPAQPATERRAAEPISVPPRRPAPPRSLARRLTPLDVFAALNVMLFLFMCVFTYYARFVHYRGAANVWEFFVYAAVILAGIAALWRFFRPYAFGSGLLTLIQIGILAHFAGAFIQFDGQRLYDCYVVFVRYDKYVHFANAFIAVLAVRHVFARRGMRTDAISRFFILMTVLGLGAVIEIVEYIVCKTIPGNGVGGYDNNMQDLIANLVGGTLCVIVVGSGHGGPRLARPGRGPRGWNDAIAGPASFERTLSAVELGTLFAGVMLAVWLGPWLVPLPGFIPAVGLVLVATLVYVSWFSPARLHGDSMAERGLGTWRTLFVRTDNLRPAARRFGMFALGGTTVILLLAEMRNPGWFGRANWTSWGVRLGFYALSAFVQAFVFVGFGLVRLKSLLASSHSTGFAGRVAGQPGDLRQRLIISSVAAAIFAALHAPNPPAMALTAVFGFAVAWIGVRTPNVIAAAGCQALLGLLVHRVLGLSLRIGAFYSHPDTYIIRDLIPLAHRLIGNLY